MIYTGNNKELWTGHHLNDRQMGKLQVIVIRITHNLFYWFYVFIFMYVALYLIYKIYIAQYLSTTIIPGRRFNPVSTHALTIQITRSHYKYEYNTFIQTPLLELHVLS